mmetsp:Transcript_31493/g.65893  ORF Transcript_31493/g.65893 Transcript_31493/m.65893 type:complete len:163 (-) Transcript_31493:317-805(-)
MLSSIKSVISGVVGWGGATAADNATAASDSDKTSAQESEKHVEATRPVEKRDYTAAELKQFDGSVPDVAILIAIRGTIFDVSSRKDIYGIGGAYSWLAGREASRLLAKMAKDTGGLEEDDLSDLTEKELKVLEEWDKFYRGKYDIVGSVIPSPGGSTNGDCL